MGRRKRRTENVLLEKGGAEHGRLLGAFTDRRAAAWPGTDGSGEGRVARAPVLGVQHAGTKTLFVLRLLERSGGRRSA